MEIAVYVLLAAVACYVIVRLILRYYFPPDR
jgi:hypothetical protein